MFGVLAEGCPMILLLTYCFHATCLDRRVPVPSGQVCVLAAQMIVAAGPWDLHPAWEFAGRWKCVARGSEGV